MDKENIIVRVIYSERYSDRLMWVRKYAKNIFELINKGRTSLPIFGKKRDGKKN